MKWWNRHRRERLEEIHARAERDLRRRLAPINALWRETIRDTARLEYVEAAVDVVTRGRV